MSRLVLGTRGSGLALAQARMAAAALVAACGIDVFERVIKTTGDVRLDVTLSDPGGLDKGLFTKELETALVACEIDAAVHSLKDLPVGLPEGLVVGAVLRRESPDDLLVSKHEGGVEGLPQGARVGTSSLRRAKFLRWKRPDLEAAEIRGNVPTRIRKLANDPELDAVVLARAGISRLRAAGIDPGEGRFHVSPIGFMLPAPGQGAVALECRAGDRSTLGVLAAVHDAETAACVDAERALLSGLGGGCHTPLGALAVVDGGALVLRAAWFCGDADVPLTGEARGPLSEPASVARDVIAFFHAETHC